MPERVQLRRSKGWRMPPDTLKVDRTTRWGNPFRIGEPGVPDAETAVRMFRESIASGQALSKSEQLSPGRIEAELAGKNLACWCRLDQPCHADVLLELAN